MKTQFAFLLFAAFPLLAVGAPEVCESSKGLVTPGGKIRKTECTEEGARSRAFISIDDQKLVEDRVLSYRDRNDSRALWIHAAGRNSREIGCETRHYLIDVSMSPPKVFAFGVKNACNEFHWASWGDKRSVIALKHNVRFVYENGKLIPPEKGEKLWKAIEPPHAGNGLALEDAIPFVEEVPLPK